MLMKRFCLFVATAMAAFAVLTVDQAGAVPGAPGASVSVPAAETSGPSVELAHGCHRGILRDNRGWHFHTGACVRRNTAPPGLYDYPQNRRYYRGPLCTYRCSITNGLKVCRQVCR